MKTDKIELSPDEYRTLVNAIDDKIYNLTTVIDRTTNRNNFVWIEQVNMENNNKKSYPQLNQNKDEN